MFSRINQWRFMREETPGWITSPAFFDLHFFGVGMLEEM
jgi:hypothetical protein